MISASGVPDSPKKNRNDFPVLLRAMFDKLLLIFKMFVKLVPCEYSITYTSILKESILACNFELNDIFRLFYASPYTLNRFSLLERSSTLNGKLEAKK